MKIPLQGWEYQKRAHYHGYWTKLLPGSWSYLIVADHDGLWRVAIGDQALLTRAKKRKQFRSMRAAMVAAENEVRQRYARDLEALAPEEKP